MVKMMIFVAYLMAADGATYATIKTQPIPAADCLHVLSTKVNSERARYECVPVEVAP